MIRGNVNGGPRGEGVGREGGINNIWMIPWNVGARCPLQLSRGAITLPAPRFDGSHSRWRKTRGRRTNHFQISARRRQERPLKSRRHPSSYSIRSLQRPLNTRASAAHYPLEVLIMERSSAAALSAHAT